MGPSSETLYKGRRWYRAHEGPERVEPCRSISVPRTAGVNTILPFTRALMKVGQHPSYASRGFAGPGKSRHPSKVGGDMPLGSRRHRLLALNTRGGGIRLSRSRCRWRLAGGFSLPGWLRACPGRATLRRREERLRRCQRRCAAGGTWMRMSRYCWRVSTAAVAGSWAPVAGGKRAVCRGDRSRPCQRHRVSRRDRSA
jgi:hypothetical protein